jgi:hypothetical protein
MVPDEIIRAARKQLLLMKRQARNRKEVPAVVNRAAARPYR